MRNHINKSIYFLLLLAAIPILSLKGGDLDEYIQQIPGIGLIADEINFEGICLKNLKFDQDSIESPTEDIQVSDKFAILHANQEVTVLVDYQLDKKILEDFSFHHFIYGLHPEGPQGCILHSLGLADSVGTTFFRLRAPEKKGAYQLRFCHAEGYGTFEHVKNEWWKDNKATSQTIMGIVIVK
ncbi:MAG: hypothetical protein Tsb0021_06990 [Chlamydiales bacterium]